MGTSAVKATAKKVVKSPKLQSAKAKAIEIARTVGSGGTGVLGPFVQAAATVISKMPSPKQLAKAKDSRQKAEAAVKAVEKDLAKHGQKLTKKQKNVLLKQHIDYYQGH